MRPRMNDAHRPIEPSKPLVIWAMTTGEAGMRSQARGLAAAIGGEVVEKTIGLRAPWRWLPGHLAPGALRGLTSDSDPVTPPWPDVLVTSGRRSAAVSIAIKRLASPKVITVHVQNPLCRLDAFDLVIAMRHDRNDGPNVITVDTAMHHVSAARLAEAAEVWRPRLAHLPRPLTGVLLGGSNRAYRFTPERADAMIDALAAIRKITGGGLAITPSRRTDPEASARFVERFGNDPNVLLWNFEGDNPYLGILALSDRLVVTNETVSMISEALATPHPVEIFPLEGSGRRHAAFVDALIGQGLAAVFDGTIRLAQSRTPIDATPEIAARVRALALGRPDNLFPSR
jgi:uncharacterized protein